MIFSENWCAPLGIMLYPYCARNFGARICALSPSGLAFGKPKGRLLWERAMPSVQQARLGEGSQPDPSPNHNDNHRDLGSIVCV